MKILLIEDDLVDQMAFSRWISKTLNPCHLVVANGTKEVAAIADLADFEVVVCDYHLPDGTILDVTQLIDPQIVICVSGIRDPSKIQQLKKIGVPVFLFKDNHLDYLNQLKEIIDQRHLGLELQTADKAEEASRSLINLSHLQRAFDHKTEPIKDIIQIFLQQTPQQLSDLQNALENRHLQQCHSLAHRLKSSFRMMGLFSQMEILQTIEDACCQDLSNPVYYLNLLHSVQEDVELAYSQLTEELERF